MRRSFVALAAVAAVLCSATYLLADTPKVGPVLAPAASPSLRIDAAKLQGIPALTADALKKYAPPRPRSSTPVAAHATLPDMTKLSPVARLTGVTVNGDGSFTCGAAPTLKVTAIGGDRDETVVLRVWPSVDEVEHGLVNMLSSEGLQTLVALRAHTASTFEVPLSTPVTCPGDQIRPGMNAVGVTRFTVLLGTQSQESQYGYTTLSSPLGNYRSTSP